MTLTSTPRSRSVARALALSLAVVILAAGCGDDSQTTGEGTTTSAPPAEPVIDPGDGGKYAPDIDPADFVEGIDNPYLPFAPGTRWVYEGESDGEHERTEVVVTDQTREIGGITATVVRDTVRVGGEIAEDTYDWFAQDRDGNVWYLGEDSHEYEDGKATSAAGSWEHGVDGAVAGIVMPAHPTVRDAYRQEYDLGNAEDMAEIVAVAVARSIGFGDYDDVVVTKEWNPLEPDVVEEKWYAAGIGMIYEGTTSGPSERAELVEFEPRG